MINQPPDQPAPAGGQLLANLLHFARLLRQLSIPVSSYQVSGLARGLDLIDLTSEQDFYNTARPFLLHDISKLKQFDLAFDIFWSSNIKMILEIPGNQRKLIRQEEINREAGASSKKIEPGLLDTIAESTNNHIQPNVSELQIKPLYSPYEILRYKDFSQYSVEEFRQAKAVFRKMAWWFEKRRSRRKVRAAKQSKFLDFRRSIRNNMKVGGELIDLEWSRNKYKPRPLIVLCDISGSMEKYSQIFLYFLYAMAQETTRIETFVFGTRLTRLTMLLQKKRPDQVIENLSSLIMDWSGGTRIGESIKEFNYQWARRVRCQRSIVMIISDGWDRGDYQLLDREVSRLSRTAHRLMWINPLAGSQDYQPLVKGMQTVLPYVDDFYPLTNLKNLESLALGLDFD
jgi:hypothetical protein